MKRLVLIALVLGGGIALVWLGPKWFRNDEKQIRSMLNTLGEAVSVKASDGNFARVAKVNKIISSFTEDVLVNLQGVDSDIPAITSRNVLQESINVAYVTGRAIKEMDLKFTDVLVKLAPEKEKATVYSTALIKAPGYRDAFAQELKMLMSKTNGNWLISRVDTVKTLQ